MMERDGDPGISRPNWWTNNEVRASQKSALFRHCAVFGQIVKVYLEKARKTDNITSSGDNVVMFMYEVT